MDRGSSGIATPVAHYTQDDYVWLGGRPVVMVRGKLSDAWTRLSDTSTDCARNGDAAACGVYFPVTDHIGKPVLMLDGSGRVVGSADYDPFGQVNRVALNAETEHPLDSSTPSTSTLAAMGQPMDASLRVKMRVLFHLLDMTAGQVELVDGESGPVLASISGTNRARFWSDWVQPTTESASVRMVWPGSGYGPPSAGVALEGYEYQRYQVGAQAFWTPLRFPGQYYDAETDLFENWNRYYDPSIGRYLQPDPFLQKPRYSRTMAERGFGAPAYAYASNNALYFTDPTGLIIWTDSPAVRHWIDIFKKDPFIGDWVSQLDADPNFKVNITEEPGLGTSWAHPQPGGWAITIKIEGANTCDARNGRGGLGASYPVLISHELGHVWAGYTGQSEYTWLWAVIWENSQRPPDYPRRFHHLPEFPP